MSDNRRATAAAPTYFEAALIHSGTGVEYPLIDGGTFANNPTMCAYAEVRTHLKVPGGETFATAAEMAILSLGTGAVHKPYFYAQAKDWGVVGWVRPLIDMMMTGVSETVDYQVRKIYQAVERPNQYLRINVDLNNLPPGVTSDMDNADDENLRGLLARANEEAERREEELTSFARLLIDVQ